ncbi:tetratricopeptide (TPR) repeat protein [Parabacteroides sp. PFB2-10]|uniref:tetratricopeptide repeat protein n=1 Tax=Parabacteroides sp. PFB2-10 TaxID=1742405 RepID=UPI002475FF19|nr:tetratricopeptide repeat protein [Parabacteroides sp. PFB2-10]MDH6312189.1 tetratricopeptide (TPR) repeat protein [Parabacteroides sp. PFB2-10]
MKKILLLCVLWLSCLSLWGQVNTERVTAIGRNALYFEDYVLSIQYFNQVIKAKPYLAEPYFYRAVAKINLDDFKGAEDDCTLCIERNPFLVQAYYARGIARHNQNKLAEAIEDYKKGLEYRPEDRGMLVNLSVAYIQQKEFTQAEETFEKLMAAHPRESMNYMTRGAMYIEQGDTLNALADYNKAVEMDPYYAPAYGNRGILRYQTHDLEGALADFNDAIRLDTRQSGYFINRGLVRYQMNDLRGAMADYDQVVAMDSRNLIARFNRGLLRAQVGDTNRAIEDFDVVIELEPNNFMAYYNRALLRYETGDMRGSINDLNVVLAEYPSFIDGYYTRADAKRRMNDLAGSDRDFWAAIKLEEQMSQGGTIRSAAHTAQKKEDDPQEESQEDKTREQSDKTIEKFNRLVVYDKEDEWQNKYQSDIRGRVQDRNVRVDLEPLFILTYYEKPDPVKKLVYYDKTVEDFNNRQLLPRLLRITNEEAPLNEAQVAVHFNSINQLSQQIQQNPQDEAAYFARAIDYMLVQDFQEAMLDYDRVIELDPSFSMAYYNRAVVRYKQMEYEMSTSANSQLDLSPTSMTLNSGRNQQAQTMQDQTALKSLENQRSYAHENIVRDYDKVIQLNPDFVYAWFNRGNLRCAQRDYRAAILDYNEAILRNPTFAEAYFNRGLARLSLGDTTQGITDLSKAGELGIINAYNIIKRMTN